MPKKKSTKALEVESRLARLSQDLNRTFLHGARARTNDGLFKPAMIVTGQQIPVDVPASGSMKFNFVIGTAKGTVDVPHDDAVASEKTMRAAVASPEKYLKLEVDKNVPTWVFHQREFTLPDHPVPEEVVKIADQKKTVLRLPATVLQEVQRVGHSCDVSLWQYDAQTQDGTVLPTTWQPAILLRFPLRTPTSQRAKKARTAEAGTEKIFELEGTPQGDRYYLDLLGLLPGHSIPDAPTIDSVNLFLEEPGKPPEPSKTWTLARTNLTQESRPGQFRELRAEPEWPLVATEGQPEDTLRLLEMTSITNSGGYFIKMSTSNAPKTLVVCIFLKPGKSNHESSVSFPQAANAIVYDDKLTPNIARFEGIENVQVTPFAPPGFVAFGWTRTEPVEKPDDEQKFGYGTISLVAYQGIDAAGNVWDDANSGVAISPLQKLPGDHIPKATLSRIQDEHHASVELTSTNSAAMRVLAPHHRAAQKTALVPADRTKDASEVRYYRASMCCYDPNSESPFSPLADVARRSISISPSFRDVFGNRFETSGAEIKTKLFYTDALIAPGEWPGFRFNIFPGDNAGQPVLSLEVAYTPVADGQEKESRYVRLIEILNQLKGAKLDVQLSLYAPPLLQNVPVLTKDLTKWLIETVIPLENPKLTGGDRKTIFLPGLGPYRCDGAAFKELRQFQPRLEIVRTDGTLLPQATDLPSDRLLGKVICAQVAKATSAVNLASNASGSLFKGDDKRKDEFALIAKAFQDKIASSFGVQVGFLRDQLNQHELWLIPNEIFPSVPAEADQSKWSYATARPLSNKLGTDEFVVPDFTQQTAQEPNWKGYLLKSKHFVEQDFDELARSVFSLVEGEAFRPELVTDASVVDATKSALRAKEQIAGRLAYFDGVGDPSYLIPLFAGGLTTLDPKAASRLGTDAFLRSLFAFYTVDTLIQLPLDRLGDEKQIVMFEGKVSNPFSLDSRSGPDDPVNRLPAFSDVLFKSGEKKITILYNVPPGTHDPNDEKNEVPPIPDKAMAFNVQIRHVQRKLDDSSGTERSAFNQGAWLQLAVPWQLAWHGTGRCVPVAIRRFPLKPKMDDPEIGLPELPEALTAKDIPLLIKWGWKVGFVAEGLSSDIVHVTIRYNEPDTEQFGLRALADAEWAPTSLLHCLVVLKQLGDNWATIPSTIRMEIVSFLLASLAEFLSKRSVRLQSVGAGQPQDLLDVSFPRLPKEPPKPVSYEVMHQIDADTSDAKGGPGNWKRVVLTAPANNAANKAYLVASQDAGGAGCRR